MSKRQALCALGLGGATVVLGVATWRKAQAQGAREIEIIAQRFRFTPNVIDAKRGEPLLLLIRSLDYIHGFSVPDLGVRSDLLPGTVVQLRITPQVVGRLDFLCDNFCGDGHETMHGQFNVTE